jgi:hypothetical protein
VLASSGCRVTGIPDYINSGKQAAQRALKYVRRIEDEKSPCGSTPPVHHWRTENCEHREIP